MADPPLRDDPLDEAFAAYLRFCDEGQLESREAFLAQYPELSAQLKELIDAADMLGSFSFGRSAGNTEPGDVLAATLPMDHRSQGDSGPTLPFELGDYRLLKVLGRGGMGVVYLAEQHALGRQVAVKMIRSGILAGEAEVRRFYIEAQAAARLHHPGIVSVYQFGQRAGHHFFSMEYVRGRDLQRK